MEKESINKGMESEFKKEFALQRLNDSWKFEGGTIISEVASKIKSAEDCIGILSALKKKMHFTKVCIHANRTQVVVICNTKPKPACLITKLGVDDVAEVVHTRARVINYANLFMFDAF